MTQVFVQPVKSKKKKTLESSPVLSFGKKYFIIILLVISIFLVIILALNKTVWSPDRYVSSIIYSQNSRSIISDKSFYDFVTSKIYGKNIYDVRYISVSLIENEIRQSYPFLESLTFENFVSGQLFIDVVFRDPSYVIKNDQQVYAMYGDYFHKITTGSSLGESSSVLFFPNYLSGSQSLSGLFFTIPSQDLTNIVEKITQTNYFEKLVYLAGGEKFVGFLDNKRVYFNAYADIDNQLSKLESIQKNYSGYSLLQEIDLGTLDHVIVK